MIKEKVRIDLKTTTTCAKIAPNGEFFAVSTASGVIKVYNINGKFRTKLVGHSKGVSDICWSPDSCYIASASDDCTVKIWCMKQLKCLKTLVGHYYTVNCVRYNYKGNLLVTGSSDEAVRVWDVVQGKCLKTLSAHSDPIASVDICWDGTVLASGSYDGLIRFFDVLSGQCLKTLMYEMTDSSFPISYVRFSPNGKYLLASSLDGVIRLWDYTTGSRVVKTYSLSGVDANSSGIAEKYSCSTDFVTSFENPMVISGSESGRVFFWDLESKKVVESLHVSDSPVLQVDLYDGGSKICACALDGTIVVWEL